MNSKRNLKPYDLAVHEETEAIHIVAFGALVPGAPLYQSDDIEEARKLCDLLNAAYNAGVAGKGRSDDYVDKEPAYNSLTRNGS